MLVLIHVSLLALDLDRAVLQQSYESANGCEDRRKHRTDHASREREFGQGATFMLHHDASDVALVDETFELPQHAFTLGLERIPVCLSDISCSPLSTRRHCGSRSPTAASWNRSADGK